MQDFRWGCTHVGNHVFLAMMVKNHSLVAIAEHIGRQYLVTQFYLFGQKSKRTGSRMIGGKLIIVDFHQQGMPVLIHTNPSHPSNLLAVGSTIEGNKLISVETAESRPGTNPDVSVLILGEGGGIILQQSIRCGVTAIAHHLLACHVYGRQQGEQYDKYVSTHSHKLVNLSAKVVKNV